MNLRLTYAAVTGQFTVAVRAMQKPIATAATASIKDLAAEIVSKGRGNIASAGFSTRWQKGLVVTVTPKEGASIDCEAHVFHKRGFATVFETGMQISGKPLLWLPLPTLPDKIGSQPMTPKNFIRSIGPLYSLKSAGKRPMLVRLADLLHRQEGGREIGGKERHHAGHVGFRNVGIDTEREVRAMLLDGRDRQHGDPALGISGRHIGPGHLRPVAFRRHISVTRLSGSARVVLRVCSEKMNPCISLRCHSTCCEDPSEFSPPRVS